jgi:hypothetical protein
MTLAGHGPVKLGENTKPMADSRYDPSSTAYGQHFAYRDLAGRPALGNPAECLGNFATSLTQLLLKRAIRYERIAYEVRMASLVRSGMRFAGFDLTNLAAGAVSGCRDSTVAPKDNKKIGRDCCLVATMPASPNARPKAAGGRQFDVLDARRGNLNGELSVEGSWSQAKPREQGALFLKIDTRPQESRGMMAAAAHLWPPLRLIDAPPLDQ